MQRNFILTDVMKTGFHVDLEDFINLHSLTNQTFDMTGEYYTLHGYDLDSYDRKFAIIDWRYDNNDKLIENFNLNSINNDSKILLSGRNFGCGSSREHAAWAIYDYGFRVVVSSFFADIFRNNALNNGLLVIQLSQNKIDQIFDKVSNNINTVFSVDLNDQKFYSSDGTIDEKFEINEYNKTCLINGYDNIDYLLSVKDKILKFESNLK